MRNKILKSPQSGGVCAFCAVHLLRRPSPRFATLGGTSQRSIWSTATARKTEEDHDVPNSAGWGLATANENNKSRSGWGSHQASSDWGSTGSTSNGLLTHSDMERQDAGETTKKAKPNQRFTIRKIDTASTRPHRPQRNSPPTLNRKLQNEVNRKNSSSGLPESDRADTAPVLQHVNSAVRERWRHVQFRASAAEEPNTEWTVNPNRKSNRQTDTQTEQSQRRAVSWGLSDGSGGPIRQPRFADMPSRQTPAEEQTEMGSTEIDRQSQRRSPGKGRKFGDDHPQAQVQQQQTRQERQTEYSKKKQRHAGRKSNNEDDEVDDKVATRMEQRAQRKAERKAKKTSAPPTPIILPDFISVGNLASVLRVRTEEFVRKLEELGFEDITNDHVINAEDAGLIAQEFNFEPMTAQHQEVFEDIVALPEPSAQEKEFLLNRPPVITIMGHVDHGKTTLLDFLRKSSVAAGEHGGITQHIGAFTVNMPSGRTITFLDTPGHAAFLDMRARGANVTDIVILVVAADDSVKPQTIEAIKHAKGAGVPMIVAISKADKEDADPDRVKRDLAQNGVEVEEYGGDVQAIPVSGKTGHGMEDLEDAAIALADILDVRAPVDGQIEGYVLESSIKSNGKVATVLVRRGTLRPGSIVVAGQTWARVRTLRNEAGQIVQEASPGQPVEVDGWDESPEAGAEVLEAPNLQRARHVAQHRQDQADLSKVAADVAATNEQRSGQRHARQLAKDQDELDRIRETDPTRAAELQAALDLAKANEEQGKSSDGTATKGSFIQVPLIMRADVAGSVEALSASLQSLGNNEIRAEVLRAEVGGISESDIELAATARGVLVSFGVPVEPAMRRSAEQEGVRIIDGSVIYRVTDEVKELLEDRLPRIISHKVVGEADVLQIFQYSIKCKGKIGVAGCRVRNGTVEKAKHFKVMRGKQVLLEGGKLSALKSHKKEVNEIRKGSECGISFVDFEEFQEGDQIQCYDIIEEKRTL